MLGLTPGGPVVVFGGTFDPPTSAHVTLPPLAAQALSASRLIYVPASMSPHKADSPPTSPAHRLAMLRLILPSGAEIDTRELDRGGISFMIDTIRSMIADLGPHVDLRLLIGTDQMASFHRWQSADELMALAPPAVMVRGEDDVEGVLAAIEVRGGAEVAEAWRNRLLDLPHMGQSSTRARAHVQSGSSLEGDVPGAVAEYIASHHLYGAIT